MSINKIAVYCASASGFDPIYVVQAKALGEKIAQQGKTLVYGGAHVGLMGSVADGVLSQGGEVYGVIPQFLKKKSFRQYCQANQEYHKTEGTLCSAMKAMIEFENKFPDIAAKYFDLRFDRQKYVIDKKQEKLKKEKAKG